MQHFLKVWFLFVLPNVQTQQRRVVGPILPSDWPFRSVRSVSDDAAAV